VPFIMNNVQARINTFLGSGPYIATEASFKDHLLWIRTCNPSDPAPNWHTPSDPSEHDLYIYPFLGVGALLSYTQKEQLRGTTTVTVVSRYLEECHLRPSVQVLPHQSRIAVKIESPLPLVTLFLPDQRKGPNRWGYVDIAEFIGSAVYTVFHSLQRVNPREITSVKCNTNDARPFPR